METIGDDLREEARYAEGQELREDPELTWAEAEREKAPPAPRPYVGNCAGCGKSLGDPPGGFCLWGAGTWHPACRDKARERAGGKT
jgi:hypothetical protein